jgi:hypothetical protein
MLWSEIKRWAKNSGYEVIKDKDGYYWSKADDPSCSGISSGVGILARDIFNNKTNNKYIEYQNNYYGEISYEQLR